MGRCRLGKSAPERPQHRYDDRPRFDIIIPDVLLSLFNIPAHFAKGETPGCAAPTICLGDEVAVEGFTAKCFDQNNALIRSFGADNAQLVAQELLQADGVTPLLDANGVPLVDQNVAWILFSIRFSDVVPLVPGSSSVVVSMNGVILASATFSGNSALNDAQDVVVTSVSGGSLAAANLSPAPVVVPAPFVAANGANVTCQDRGNGNFRCRGRGLASNAIVTITEE